MSDEVTKLPTNPLSPERHRTWKETCEAMALHFDAYDILKGTEPKPATTDKAEFRDYNKRCNKFAGYLLSTLDEAHRTIIKGKDVKDIQAIWKALNDYYESKDPSTRFFATQKLMTITYQDPEHPNESLTEYGNRAVNAGNLLKELIPTDITITPAIVGGTCKTDGSHTVDITVTTQPTAVPDFSASDLVDEFVVSIIILGLGTSENTKMVKHAIMHGTRTIADAFKELRNADQQSKSDELAGGSGTALAARGPIPDKRKGREWQPYYCKEHGPNKSHATKDCKKLKKPEAEAKVAVDDEQKALIAGVPKVACPMIEKRTNQPTDSFWNADSGATSHMTPHKGWMRNMTPCKIPVKLANDKVVWAVGKGQVVFNPRGFESIVLTKVLYVPDLANNLFSIISSVLDSKLRVVIENDELVFSKDGKTIFKGKIRGKIAMLDGRTLHAEEQAFVSVVSKKLLHERLGHIGEGRLNTLVNKNLSEGILVDKSSIPEDTCEHCIAGKQHRNPFPNLATNRSTTIIERIHTDVHGPLPRTLSGYRYWVTFVDDAGRMKDAVPLKTKGEASEETIKYITYVERQTGNKVKIIRDDKGGEYMNKDLQKFLDDKGIKRERTNRATPSQNGVAERLNRTLAEGIVAMLSQANLPQSFWAQALLYLVEILNVTPSSSTSDTSSYEYWYKKKPDLSKFRVFGCRMYVNVLRKDRKNLDSHTRPCIFVGFEKGYKGWKYYDPSKKPTGTRVGVTGDAIFDERSFPGLGQAVEEPKLNIRSFWFSEDSDDTGIPTTQVQTNGSQSSSTHNTVPQTTTSQTTIQAIPQTIPQPIQQQPTPPPSLPPVSVSFPSTSQSPPNTPNKPLTSRRRTYAESTSSPGPSLSQRPVRKVTEKVTDYYDGVGTRRSTKPAKRRMPGSLDQGGEPIEEDEEVMDQGGEYGQNDPRPETTTTDDEADIEEALKTTPVVESIQYVYGESDDFVSWKTAHEIGLEIATEKALSAAVNPEDSPRTWKEAMSRSDSEKWLDAAEKEVEALRENGTWELVQLPPNRKAIGSRWVFLIKRKSDGTIDRYKARLVAKGYAQIPGMDFDQVFAPTTRLAALRAILAQAALNGECIESIDVSNAYLNGELEKEYDVYMTQPEGFIEKGDSWVCKLKKGLYGLKQAGRLWYQKLGESLEKIGFKQINADPSVYVWLKDGVRVILPVFVDDITITSKDAEMVKWVKKEIGKHFKIKDLGSTSFLLGIKVEYDQKGKKLTLSQSQYILDILSRFNMTDCNPVTTPMDPGSTLSKEDEPKTDEDKDEMKKIPYINAVGALMYLAVGTRPDIAYTVAKLAQFNSNPGQQHWNAVKHLMRYLKGTVNLKLTYQPIEDKAGLSGEVFRAYSDSDHAGCRDTRRSTTGYMLKMGTGAVSWSSKKQTSVAWSSTEAEYIAASTTGQEIIWMRELLKELGFKIDTPSPLIVDNQSAIAVIKNPEHHGRMKHVDVRYHWIRQEVRRKNISIHHIPTTQMTADILTKPLPKPLVEEHRLGLGIM